MSENRYRVVTTGEQLIADIDEIRRQISAIFDLSEKQLDVLVGGKPLVIKKEITASNAMQYKKALIKCGLGCMVEPMSEESIVEAQDLPSAAVDAAAQRVEPISPPLAHALPSTSQQTPQVVPQISEKITTKEPVAKPPADLMMAPAGARIGPRPSIMKHVIPSTDHLTADFADRLVPEKTPGPPPPNVDHLVLGEVGERLGVAKTSAQPPPKVPPLDLSEAGTQIGPDKVEVKLELDLSHISLEKP